MNDGIGKVIAGFYLRRDLRMLRLFVRRLVLLGDFHESGLSSSNTSSVRPGMKAANKPSSISFFRCCVSNGIREMRVVSAKTIVSSHHAQICFFKRYIHGSTCSIKRPANIPKKAITPRPRSRIIQSGDVESDPATPAVMAPPAIINIAIISIAGSSSSMYIQATNRVKGFKYLSP